MSLSVPRKGFGTIGGQKTDVILFSYAIDGNAL